MKHARALQAGKRVLLRRPVPKDEAEFLALLRASETFLRPWEPRPPPGLKPSSPERFRRMLRARRDDRHEKLLICRREDGDIVGYMGINEIIMGPFQSAFLGYWTGAPHVRRGYMTEALQLALRHAFRTLKLHRVEANIIPRNKASKALVKRAGFTREGLSRRYLKIAGRWQDNERWVLLREDWKPQRAT